MITFIPFVCGIAFIFQSGVQSGNNTKLAIIDLILGLYFLVASLGGS